MLTIRSLLGNPADFKFSVDGETSDDILFDAETGLYTTGYAITTAGPKLVSTNYELAGLVKLQGEMIDDICENIAVSKTNVTDAEENIIKAKENMSSARKKKCIILVIVVIVLGVVLFLIFGL